MRQPLCQRFRYAAKQGPELIRVLFKALEPKPDLGQSRYDLSQGPLSFYRRGNAFIRGRCLSQTGGREVSIGTRLGSEVVAPVAPQPVLACVRLPYN